MLDGSRCPKQLVNLGVALAPQGAGAASFAPAGEVAIMGINFSYAYRSGPVVAFRYE